MRLSRQTGIRKGERERESRADMQTSGHFISNSQFVRLCVCVCLVDGQAQCTSSYQVGIIGECSSSGGGYTLACCQMTDLLQPACLAADISIILIIVNCLHFYSPSLSLCNWFTVKNRLNCKGRKGTEGKGEREKERKR